MDIETILELKNKIQAQEREIKILKSKLNLTEEVLLSHGIAVTYPPIGEIDTSKKE
jgi:hypothetical protein